MGYYAGPAPEPSAFDDLRCALDDLQGALGEKIAPALLPIADFLAQQIDAQHEPRRIAKINPSPTTPRPNVRPAPQHPRTPATGPTQRLVCRACGDAPPKGARFCIECGAPI